MHSSLSGLPVQVARGILVKKFYLSSDLCGRVQSLSAVSRCVGKERCNTMKAKIIVVSNGSHDPLDQDDVLSLTISTFINVRGFLNSPIAIPVSISVRIEGVAVHFAHNRSFQSGLDRIASVFQDVLPQIVSLHYGIEALIEII